MPNAPKTLADLSAWVAASFAEVTDIRAGQRAQPGRSTSEQPPSWVDDPAFNRERISLTSNGTTSAEAEAALVKDIHAALGPHASTDARLEWLYLPTVNVQSDIERTAATGTAVFAIVTPASWAAEHGERI